MHGHVVHILERALACADFSRFRFSNQTNYYLYMSGSASAFLAASSRSAKRAKPGEDDKQPGTGSGAAAAGAAGVTAAAATTGSTSGAAASESSSATANGDDDDDVVFVALPASEIDRVLNARNVESLVAQVKKATDENSCVHAYTICSGKLN